MTKKVSCVQIEWSASHELKLGYFKLLVNICFIIHRYTFVHILLRACSTHNNGCGFARSNSPSAISYVSRIQALITVLLLGKSVSHLIASVCT